jgi:hypothetical protein
MAIDAIAIVSVHFFLVHHPETPPAFLESRQFVHFFLLSLSYSEPRNFGLSYLGWRHSGGAGAAVNAAAAAAAPSFGLQLISFQRSPVIPRKIIVQEIFELVQFA